MSSLFI